MKIKIRDFLRRLIQLARPRVIKFDGGKAELQGTTPEQAKAIEAILTGNTETTTELAGDVVEYIEPTIVEYTNVALGTFQDSNDKLWKVAYVRYNPETKQATVEKIETSGDSKLHSTEAFKIAAVKNELVS